MDLTATTFLDILTEIMHIYIVTLIVGLPTNMFL